MIGKNTVLSTLNYEHVQQKQKISKEEINIVLSIFITKGVPTAKPQGNCIL